MQFASDVLKGAGNVVKGSLQTATAVTAGAAGGAVGFVAGTVTEGDPLGGMAKGAGKWGHAGYDVVGATCDGIGEGAVAVAKTAITDPHALQTATVNGVVGGAGMAVRAVPRLVESCINGWFDEQVTGLPYACAFLSSCVYEEPEKRARTWGIGRITVRLDPAINLPNLALYLLDDSEMVLAFKGTSDRNDIGPDLAIIFASLISTAGAKEEELKGRLGFHQESFGSYLQSRHPNRKLIVTGHSLGGAAAMVMASAPPNCLYVDQCFAFNPGTGLAHNDVRGGFCDQGMRKMALLRELEWCWSTINGEAKNIEVHHIWGDVISAATTSSCKTRVQTWHNRLMNAHSMDNFLSSAHAAKAGNQACSS
jgi:hypothetical protein